MEYEMHIVNNRSGETHDSLTRQKTNTRHKPVVDVARDAQCWVHNAPSTSWAYTNCSVYQLSIHSSHARTVRHWLYHRERVL